MEDVKAKRKKTTVMLPLGIAKDVEYWGQKLGVGQNGFISLASAFLLVQLSRLEPRQKRRLLLKSVDGEIQRLMDDARDAA